MGPETSITSRISDRNPFVGPRPIQQGEALHGRDIEVRELYNQLQARRIVVLHSPSGAGKSSLVHAGLIPRLRSASYDVWKPIRVNLDPTELKVSGDTNRYALSAMLSLEDELPVDRRQGPAILAQLDFLDYVEHRPRRKSLADRPVVLLFDQFEEVLTVAPRETEARREFFAALGRALDTGKYWALFIIREDYLGALAPYRDLIPTQMANTFRLDLLGLAGAAEVAVKLAEQGGRRFPAVEQLVRDLSTVKVQRPDGSLVAEPGLHVEPVQLQVVCRRLWAAMPEDDLSIDAEDIEKYGEISKSLANYYADAVKKIAGGDRTLERKVREWVGQRLIVAGIRSQVRQEAGRSAGLDNPVVYLLVDSFLVRSEQRAGGTWFELSHDRLVEPVMEDNTQWEQANLHPLQVQARLWEQGRRNRGLLLGAEALPEAVKWADDYAALVTEGEREFLAESRDERAKEAATRRRLVVLATVAVVVAVVVAGLGVVALLARAEAVAATTKAVAAKTEAEAATGEAVRQRDAARVATMMAGARELVASGQPGLASMVAAEVPSPDGVRGWRGLVHEIFASPFPAFTMMGHDEPLTSAVWSPDGTRILTSSEDNTVRVWNVDGSGSPLILKGHEDSVKSAVWSPDGTRILTSSDDNTARVWNADGSGPPLILKGHEDNVTSAVWSPDASRILTSSWDNTARVWNADGSGSTLILKGHESFVNSAVWSPDATRILTSSSDNTARVWNADGSGSPLILKGHEDIVNSAVWSPDATRILTSSEDNTARVWNADGSGSTLILKGHEDIVNSAVWSPDAARILTSSWDKTARVWNADGSGPPLILKGHEDNVTSAVWSPDATRILTSSSDKIARVWNADGSGSTPILKGHESFVTSAVWSPDATRILTSSRDKTARVWNADGSGSTLILKGHEGTVNSAVWSPDATRILTSSDDNTARVWNADGSGSTLILKGHEHTVNSAVWSPDATRILTSSRDKTARVWNADGSGSPLILKGHEDNVTSAVWSPDATRILTSSYDKTARVWNADGSGSTLILKGHEGPVNSAVWSPDATRILTSSYDNTARVWNADGSGFTLILKGHENSVTSAVWSPDATRILTSSWDKTTRVWNADGSGSTLILKGHEGPVTSAVWSPDATRILTSSLDDTARVWPFDVELLRQALRKATVECLSPDQRQTYLLESEADAAAAHRACERSRGRAPE